MKLGAKIAILVIGLAVIALAAVRIASRPSAAKARRRPPTLVEVTLPQRTAFSQTLQLTGDVLPIRQTQVYARVYGNVESIAANIGDSVSTNQVLARIDTTELAQQYRQTEATYRDATSVFKRAKAMHDQELVSDQEFENAQTSMEVAKENFEAASTRLDYAAIRAPFAGVITRRYLDPGALVSANSADMFLLMDLDTVKVIVNVLENDVPRIKGTIRAVTTVDAFPGRAFDGKVTRVSQAVDPSNRTMPVEIDIPNRDHALKPGMFATVSLVLGEQRNALTVPTEAVLKDAAGDYVLLARQGVAHRLAVTIGSEKNSRTEILSGLADGDSVITTGQQFAHDGGPVTVKQ